MEDPGVFENEVASQRGSAPYFLVSLVAFLSELAMLATLGVVGWHAGGGGLLSVALTALGPALAVVVWSLWVAPTARRRLADPWRLILQIALFLATGWLAVLAGRTVLGVVVAAVGVVAFVSARTVDGAHEAPGRRLG
jgi:hypothetical protein